MDDSLHCRTLRNRKIPNPPSKLEKRRKRDDNDEDRDKISQGDDHRDEESDKEKQEDCGEENQEDCDEEKKVDEDGSDDCSQDYYDKAREGLEEMKNDSSFDTPFGDKRPISNVDEKSDTEKSSSSFGIFIMIVIIGVIISLIIYNISFGTSNIVDHHRERLLRWEKSFDDLVTKYGTALPEISRKVINNSVRNVLERRTPSEKFNQLEPAIILLLGSKYNPQAVKCIYQRLSQSVSEAYNEAQAPVIDAINFSKLELGEKFHDTFSKGLHCIVVDGIERLDGNTAFSLHAFADHDKAPYLDIIIFLTAYTDNRLTNTSLRTEQMDEIASHALEVSWSKNMPTEQVAGLLSRITPSVAIISDTNSSQNWLCE